MRLLLYVILLALLPCLALAQAVDIRGVVSDSVSGEPVSTGRTERGKHIPFANIILVGTTRGAAPKAYGFHL